MSPRREVLGDTDYARLLAFRVGLRRFLQWSEEQATGVGLTPAQHQLLLAIRGHHDPRGPSVGELAGTLGTRHHSVVQLVDRAEQLDLVIRRREDDQDRRVVRLALTAAGEQKLALLAATHLQELRRLAPLIDTLVEVASPQGCETVSVDAADTDQSRTNRIPGRVGSPARRRAAPRREHLSPATGRRSDARSK